MDVADAILRLVGDSAPFGVWHATSQGETTWHGFAREIFTRLGLDAGRVQPISSAQFRAAAPRPAYSVLGHDAWRMTGVAPLPHWRDSLAKALPDVVAQGPSAVR
jgi:dTDP-4-dehydrorhamnose reductase